MSLVRPAFATRAEIGKTLGPEVADLSALVGFPPDPEQELLLDATFAVNDYGLSLFFEVDVIACRQNLKTGFLKQCELGWLYITDQRLVVHSAHEMGTTREAFRDLVQLIESHSALSKRLKPTRNHGIDNGAGREGIELRTGQRIRYKARTSGGGRGLSGDKVVLDEGMFLMPEHMGSLLPTLSARPDPQVIIGSSAGLDRSEVLRRARDRGRKGIGNTQFYAEWCAPTGTCRDKDCDHELERQDCALDNEGLWLQANPQLGKRISIETVRAERQSLPPAEFARERMGWWDDPDTEAGNAFGFGAWEACRETDIEEPAPLAIALSAATDSDFASIAAAGRLPAGRVRIGAVDRRPGTAWLLEEAARIHRERGVMVVIDEKDPAADLIDDLQAAGVPVTVTKTGDYLDACAALLRGVQERTVSHGGTDDLDAAVAVARKRTVGERWAWAYKNGDVSMLKAATIAAWAVTNAVDVSLNVW